MQTAKQHSNSAKKKKKTPAFKRFINNSGDVLLSQISHPEDCYCRTIKST